jgi:hypothetical protein
MFYNVCYDGKEYNGIILEFDVGAGFTCLF